MTFTPKLQVYLKKVLPSDNNLTPICILITAIAVMILGLQGLINIIFSPSNSIWPTVINAIIVILVGAFISYLFDYTYRKAKNDKIDMSHGTYHFDKVLDWNKRTIQTNTMRAIVEFKADEAFKTSQSYVHVDFDSSHAIIGVQTSTSLTTSQIDEQVKNHFGTIPISIATKESSQDYMYELEILLSSVDWIIGQDIVDYRQQIN